MSLSTSLPQASLAATVLLSTVGTYVALSPPNPVTAAVPSTGDWIRGVNMTHRHTTKITLAPLGLLALQTSSLAYFYPNIPSSLLRHGTENGLNTNLITWSAATCIPLGLIICAGVPLRLASYAALGKDFTFALTEPGHLKTTGIYRYIQHPSYAGLIILMVCNVLLLSRMDGALACWISPSWYETSRLLRGVFSSVAWSVVFYGMCVRIRQEESMLRAKFGVNWEKWHSRTARFIPWIF